MPLEIVDLIALRIEQYMDDCPDDHLNCLWHGGEPTLMPLPFWEHVEEAFSRVDSKRFSKSIQSNLVNRNTGKIQWLLEKGYSISSSLDGPYELHSKGRGSSRMQYDCVLRNIHVVKSLNGKLGVICVVTKNHLLDPVSSLDFFESLGVNVRFNMVDTDHPDFKISHQDYRDFLLQVAREWLTRRDTPIVVEPISSDITKLFGGISSGCNEVFDCNDHFLVVEPDASIYTCNRFASNPNWKYGNLSDRSLSEFWKIISPEIFRSVEYKLEECGYCSARLLCGGGCKKQRVVENSDERRDYCSSTILYFSQLAGLLERSN
jgi:uncharacterized protein